MRVRWDNIHRVNCETGESIGGCLVNGEVVECDTGEYIGGTSGEPGECTHHWLNAANPTGAASQREPTQHNANWWGKVSASGDSIVLDNVDDQYVMNGDDWPVPAGQPMMVSFAGMLDGNTTGGTYLGSQGQCIGTKFYLGLPNQTASLKKAAGSVGGGSALAMSGTEFVDGQRFALLTIRRANGDWQLWKREPCNSTWRDVTLYNPTTGAPPNRDASICLGCLGCYYPNGWLGDPLALFSHGGEYRELALIDGDQDEQAEMDWLESEHGPWIDQGCP
jgi:hypothetical protein